MPIPDYESLMLPVLRFAADGKDHTSKELVAALSAQFGLTPDEQAERLPSGQQTVIANRAGWATTYLKKAGLIAAVRRGVFKITPQGGQILEKNPTNIDNKFLKTISEDFRTFYDLRYQKRYEPESHEDGAPALLDLRQTPEELLEQSYQTLRAELASTILQKVQTGSPESFEHLVVELLVAMGYGGSRKDAGAAIGRSRDGGIDGIIKEDRLGLDTIYIQAKRWDQPISRPEIQKFVGALQNF